MSERPDGVPTILLIEDDDDEALLFQRALRDVEAVCDVVGDGDEAIEYLSATGRYRDRPACGWPDLIVLDLGLPGRSGHSVLRWIRWEVGLTQTPVVILTSSSRGQDIRRAYQFGANSYLLKPARAEELQALAADVAKYWLRHNH